MKRREFLHKSTFATVGLSVLPFNWLDIARAATNHEIAIVIAPKAPKVTQFAASELQQYIAKATDAKLDIITEDKIPTTAKTLIFIGRSAATDAMGIDVKQLYPDGYLIKRVGDNLVILGDDFDYGKTAGFEFDPRSSRKGTLYGVYRFLEEQLGIRWLWAGESGEVIPSKQSLELLKTNAETSKPVMPWRHLFLNGDSTLTTEEVHECYLWYLRMGMGVDIGSPFSFSHSWAHLIDGNKNFEKHPEWYALIDGKRQPFREDKNGKAIAQGVQFNSSNPELISYIVDRIRSQYPTDADVIVSLSPNDGSGFCECDDCKALDHPELYGPDEGYNGIVYSDRVFTFINEVARRVRQTHPKVRVGCFSYTYFRPAPRSMKSLDPNVVISFTQQVQTFARNPELLKKHQQRLEEWLKMGNQIVLRDYIGYIGQAAALSPMSRWVQSQIDVANTHPNRIFGFYSETTYAGMETNHLDFSLLGKLAWNPKLSMSELKQKYFQDGFSNAAKSISQFYSGLEEAYCSVQDPQAAYLNGIDLWLTPDVTNSAQQHLSQAKKDSSDKGVIGRIEILARMFEYTLALRDLMFNNRKMTDAGLPMGIRNYTPKPPAQAPTHAQIMQMIEDGEHAYANLSAIIASLEKPGNGIIYCADGFRRMEAVGRWKEALADYRKLFGDAANQPIPLPIAWRFRLDPQKIGVTEKWYQTPLDDKWTTIDTDSPWEKQGYGMEKYGTPDGYNGLAWYRLDDVLIPTSGAGKKCTLWLGSVDESCKVFVNDQFVGEVTYDGEKDPDGWKKPQQFDITDVVKIGKPNNIAVQVQDLSGMGGIWKPCWLMLTPKNVAAPAMIFQEKFDDNKWQQKATISKSDDAKIDQANGILTLMAAKGLPDGHLSLTWSIDKIPADRTLQFQMRVRTNNVQENSDMKAAWQRRPQVPQVRIIPIGEYNKAAVEPKEYQWIGLPFAKSSESWQTISRVFRVPAETKKLSLSMIINAAGTYEIDDISLQSVGE